MSNDALWKLGEQSIRELEVERGILASSRTEIYGCIFGRDSLITAHSLLSVYENSKDPYYLSLVRKILRNIAELQGKEQNIESGEEPGKIIHEFRTEGHEHLTKSDIKPWFLYPDNVMRNYDTVDATPLFLMAAYEYLRVSNDAAFIEELLPHIRAAITWLMECGDTNHDGLIDYWFHPDRTHGGLLTQSWMDSADSVFFEESSVRPEYPIAPVEVQAYTYAALRDWAAYFENRDSELSETLTRRADTLKEIFNRKFVLRGRTLAYAIDGAGKPLTAPRSSMGHALWAVHWCPCGCGKPDSILADEFIYPISRRLLATDLFVRRAGVRTLSSRSHKFDPRSYHNGSIWPHDTAMLAEGLANFGYFTEAAHMRRALLKAYAHFATPVELFTFFERRYQPYKGENGQEACRVQAWSAASLLTILSHPSER
jgi:glycogen debranching enzyme